MTAIRSPRSPRPAKSIAKAALKLIKVEYEVLPHVIDPVEAMKPDAPILHDYMRTKGVKGADKPTNVVERYELGMGDVEAGFKPRPTSSSSASSTPSRCTRAISSRKAASPRRTEDGQIELWCCTQAPWVYRDRLSNILKIETAKIRVQQSEMGGGFGGKTGFYPEPIAIQLSRKAKRPVKITLTRNEVFRATGPVSGTKSRIKIGCKKDGTITAAEAELIFQTGAVHRLGVHQRAAGDVHALCAEERQDRLLRGGVEPPEGELVPRALRAAGRVRRRGRDRRARRARSAWTGSTSG